MTKALTVAFLGLFLWLSAFGHPDKRVALSTETVMTRVV